MSRRKENGHFNFPIMPTMSRNAILTLKIKMEIPETAKVNPWSSLRPRKTSLLSHFECTIWPFHRNCLVANIGSILHPCKLVLHWSLPLHGPKTNEDRFNFYSRITPGWAYHAFIQGDKLNMAVFIFFGYLVKRDLYGVRYRTHATRYKVPEKHGRLCLTGHPAAVEQNYT